MYLPKTDELDEWIKFYSPNQMAHMTKAEVPVHRFLCELKAARARLATLDEPDIQFEGMPRPSVTIDWPGTLPF